MAITMRLTGILVSGLLLCGCVSPQNLTREQADAVHYRTEIQERDVRQKCDQAGDPGSPQHMACMLEAEKPVPAK